MRGALSVLAVLLGTLSLSSARAVELDAAYQSALIHDADLQAAGFARLEAQEGIDVARSGLLPQLAYNQQRNRANTINELLATGRTTDSGDYVTSSSALTLRQPLYRKSAWAGFESAQAQAAAADANYRREDQNLGLRVTATYLDVLLARSSLALANAETAAVESQLLLAEKAFKAGVGTRTDIDDARARRDLSRARLTEATLRLDQTARDFRTVTNIDGTLLPAVNPAALAVRGMALTGLAEWLARIEETNPDLQSLRKQLEAARADVERAKGGHYPNVDLVVARQEGRSETNTTIGTGYKTDYIGVQLTVPIFSGFGVVAQVRQNVARMERIGQSLESSRRKVLAEAERLFMSVAHGIEKVEALLQAIQSGEQALISSQKGVQAGTRTRVDVLEAERRLYETRREQAFAVFELASNRMKFLALANAIDGESIKYTSGWLAAGKL
ncbi:MAG: TolC family outer membrane protein [Gammaproteobacteria bacterium]|nr:TolC family outer membrane protein [Gammaproteobacteria bacterium]